MSKSIKILRTRYVKTGCPDFPNISLHVSNRHNNRLKFLWVVSLTAQWLCPNRTKLSLLAQNAGLRHYHMRKYFYTCVNRCFRTGIPAISNYKKKTSKHFSLTEYSAYEYTGNSACLKAISGAITKHTCKTESWIAVPVALVQNLLLIWKYVLIYSYLFYYAFEPCKF